MDDMLKCLPALPFPMHVFLKALLLFRSSMERQNSLVGADQGEDRKMIRVKLKFKYSYKTKISRP